MGGSSPIGRTAVRPYNSQHGGRGTHLPGSLSPPGGKGQGEARLPSPRGGGKRWGLPRNTLTLERELKLLQEAQIAAVKPTNIIDAILHQGDTLRPEASRKTTEHLRIISPIAKHIGVNHTTPANL